VRYVYVPVGGKHRRVLATFAVFTFTAVWHDLQLNLLAWGWLIALFIIPETVVGMYFAQPRLAGTCVAKRECLHVCDIDGGVQRWLRGPCTEQLTCLSV
jgi:protein-cysteine N-palmitoyltransferase HHAT